MRLPKSWCLNIQRSRASQQPGGLERASDAGEGPSAEEERQSVRAATVEVQVVLVDLVRVNLVKT